MHRAGRPCHSHSGSTVRGEERGGAGVKRKKKLKWKKKKRGKTFLVLIFNFFFLNTTSIFTGYKLTLRSCCCRCCRQSVCQLKASLHLVVAFTHARTHARTSMHMHTHLLVTCQILTPVSEVFFVRSRGDNCCEAGAQGWGSEVRGGRGCGARGVTPRFYDGSGQV